MCFESFVLCYYDIKYTTAAVEVFEYKTHLPGCYSPCVSFYEVKNRAVCPFVLHGVNTK